MSRPRTPNGKTANGTVIHVQRVCNGCGREIGDVTRAEIEAVVAGLPLPDVRHECGCHPLNLSDFTLTPVRRCETCRQDRTGSLSETGRLFFCGYCHAITVQDVEVVA